MSVKAVCVCNFFMLAQLRFAPLRFAKKKMQSPSDVLLDVPVLLTKPISPAISLKKLNFAAASDSVLLDMPVFVTEQTVSLAESPRSLNCVTSAGRYEMKIISKRTN